MLITTNIEDEKKRSKDTQAEGLSTRVIALRKQDIEAFTTSQGLTVKFHPEGSPLPGSFWGDSEAGLIEDTLHIRPDTPVHSLLHEMCHYLCMDETRRSSLHTDAGGDYDEENAVCYLQILLAAQLTGYDSETCMSDMDDWGYTFRLGSAKRWFEEDAEDAHQWLINHGILKPALP